MICPFCRKETSSLVPRCQNCSADLDKHQKKQEEHFHSTGNRKIIIASFWGIILFSILTILLIVPYFMGYIVLSLAYILIPMGLFSSIATFIKTRKSEKKRQEKLRWEKGEE